MPTLTGVRSQKILEFCFIYFALLVLGYSMPELLLWESSDALRLPLTRLRDVLTSPHETIAQVLQSLGPFCDHHASLDISAS